MSSKDLRAFAWNRAALDELARRHGFELLAVAPVGPEPDYQRFTDWLDRGWHAGMKFLSENLHCRQDPQALLPGAQSALILGYRYGHREVWRQGPPLIAQYARIRDYHKFMRQRGKTLLSELLACENLSAVEHGRVLVDSAPLLERALAARYSSGFIGKNTMFIHPQKGSFLLLAEVFTTLRLPYDPPRLPPKQRSAEDGGCGPCRRCQTHCPTGALSSDFQLNANRCLAFWTIENREAIPLEFWPWLSRYVFGCDICQNVCPYNRQGRHEQEQSLKRLNKNLDLAKVACMSQAEYETWFGGTPLTRAKRSGLIRNALIAMYVTRDENLAAVLELLSNDSTTPPVVKETMTEIYNDPLKLQNSFS